MLNALNSSRSRSQDVSPRAPSLGSISTAGLDHMEEDPRSRHIAQSKKKSKKKRAPVLVNLTGTRYEVGVYFKSLLLYCKSHSQ